MIEQAVLCLQEDDGDATLERKSNYEVEAVVVPFHDLRAPPPVEDLPAAEQLVDIEPSGDTTLDFLRSVLHDHQRLIWVH